MPPCASGGAPAPPAGSSSSESDEIVPMPMGHPLPMASVSPVWEERFPLGVHASHPDCTEGVSVVLPHLEAALVYGDVDRLRVPAIHRPTGAPAYLIAPASLPCPGLLFRDLPDFSPAPTMTNADLEDWPNMTMLQILIPCDWHS